MPDSQLSDIRLPIAEKVFLGKLFRELIMRIPTGISNTNCHCGISAVAFSDVSNLVPRSQSSVRECRNVRSGYEITTFRASQNPEKTQE